MKTSIYMLLALTVALLCAYQCDGRKQRPISLVNEDTALVQPVDTLPDETSGVAPGAKSQPLSGSAPLASEAVSPTTRSPKGKNGKRNKNSPGVGGKKVKKNRNNQETQGKKKGRKNQQSSAAGTGDASSPSSATRAKKNRNQARVTSVSSVDTSAE